MGSDNTLGTFWAGQTPAAVHELNQTAFENGQLCTFTATLGATALGWDCPRGTKKGLSLRMCLRKNWYY